MHHKSRKPTQIYNRVIVSKILHCWSKKGKKREKKQEEDINLICDGSNGSLFFFSHTFHLIESNIYKTNPN